MPGQFYTEHSGRVLIIAGSDSSGGAGIQADIKTVTRLGGYAMTAITAITAQNTSGVQDIFYLPNRMVEAQILACLDDIGADCVKTGMLGSTHLVECVAAQLSVSAPHTPWIIDPVMVASSGDRLLEPDAIDAIRTELVAHATLVTPNRAEAELLTGQPIQTVEDQHRAGDALLQLGAQAALIKGGHMPGDRLIDVLVTPHGVTHFENPRLDTNATHGTGCTLASAIAAQISHGDSLHEAVKTAHNYLFEAIRQAPELGQGKGPVRHNWPSA